MKFGFKQPLVFFEEKTFENVCVYSGLTSLSTIFQSYHDGVWLRQGAQCSLL